MKIRSNVLLKRAFALLITGVVLSVFLLALPVMSAEEDLYTANWVPGDSPDFSVGTTGNWDDTGVGAFCIIQVSISDYRMWYTGYDDSDILQIGYATSNDGETWTRYNGDGGPVLSPDAGTWDKDGVGSPCVSYVDSTYKMWYTGYEDIEGTKVPQIGYATSNDGINWTKSGSNPVLSPGSSGAWDEKGVHSCWVTPVSESTIGMWYTGRSGDSLIGNSAIGFATSSAGEIWTKYDGDGGPVLSPEYTWEQSGIAVPCVVWSDSEFHIYYSGYSDTGENMSINIGVAHSADGCTNLVKNPYPVLSEASSGWTEGGVGAPRLLQTASDDLVPAFSGIDSSLGVTVGSGLLDEVTITGSLWLPGGERPTAGFQIPLTMKLTHLEEELTFSTILTATPMFTYTSADSDIMITNVDEAGQTIVFTVTVPTGDYQLSLSSDYSLVNKVNATLTESTSIDFGTLYIGDANGDSIISGPDFAMILNDYWQGEGDGSWNEGRCDFDGDGHVGGLDYSILATYYNMKSPQATTE